MTNQTWLPLTILFVRTCTGVAGVASNNSFQCVVRYKAWDLPERLQVNWSVPVLQIPHDDLDINITRSLIIHGNEESCPDVDLTSCTWNYGQENNMNIDYTFMLRVTVRERKSKTTLFEREWLVDPNNCKKPPSVDHVAASAINSTCTEIKWWYNRDKYCSEKVYFKVSISQDNRINTRADVTFVQSCKTNTSHVFCKLSPFTKHLIEVQSKFVYDNQPIGHFSDIASTTVTTPEDVPAGDPEMMPGGFSLVKNDCKFGNIRVIMLFWKDVPCQLKNGIITYFLMKVISIPSSGEDEHYVSQDIDGSQYTGLVSLQCNQTYRIELRANTSVGESEVFSSINISEYKPNVGQAVEDIIPVISNDSFQVYWIVDAAIKINNSKESTVFWCIKEQGRSHCSSPIHWTPVSGDSSSVSVPVHPGTAPYKYLIGISCGDTGIKWSDCHYTSVTELREPAGLKLISDKSLRKGLMLVRWYNDPCESRVPGPYIRQFIISFCKTKEGDTNACMRTLSTIIVDKRRNSYTLEGLDTGVTYRVCIKSVGMTNIQSNPSCVIGQPAMYHSFMSQHAIIICVISATLLLSCAIYGGIKCKSHLHRAMKTFFTERFPIQIPHEDYHELETGSIVNEYFTTV